MSLPNLQHTFLFVAPTPAICSLVQNLIDTNCGEYYFIATGGYYLARVVEVFEKIIAFAAIYLVNWCQRFRFLSLFLYMISIAGYPFEALDEMLDIELILQGNLNLVYVAFALLHSRRAGIYLQALRPSHVDGRGFLVMTLMTWCVY
jgi:hypothetical protein